MSKSELPSDLSGAAVSAGALLLEAMWIQDQRAALARDRLDLAMREARLASERAKLEADRAAFARERAAQEARSSAPPPEPLVLATDGDQVVVPPYITYAWCCKFRVLPRALRMQVTRTRRSQFLRVARMGSNIGKPLDAAGIAFRWIRYVAYGEGPAEQARRRDLILQGERPKPPPRRRRARQRTRPDEKRRGSPERGAAPPWHPVGEGVAGRGSPEQGAAPPRRVRRGARVARAGCRPAVAPCVRQGDAAAEERRGSAARAWPIE